MTGPALPPGISFWHPATLIATWFGTGFLPKLPGTFGSLAALPFAWVIARELGPVGLAAAAAAAFAAGWWACGVLAAKGAEGDPSMIVIDEVAGQWLALVAAPTTPLAYVTAFALFRFFDILKPWPVDWAERRVRGPLGVMLDDLLAGLYAAAGTAFILFYSQRVGDVS